MQGESIAYKVVQNGPHRLPSLLPSLVTYCHKGYIMRHINFQVTLALNHWPHPWSKLLLLQAQSKPGRHVTSVVAVSSTNRLWSATWTGIDRYASLMSAKCAIRHMPLWRDYTTTARRMAPLHASSATFVASTSCTVVPCTSMSVSCMQLCPVQPLSKYFSASQCCWTGTCLQLWFSNLIGTASCTQVRALLAVIQP